MDPLERTMIGGATAALGYCSSGPDSALQFVPLQRIP